eukprot:1099250-Pleurochrysis_carterae.AAC.1
MIMLLLLLLLLLLVAIDAATYELECIRLGQKIDAQRNTVNNLEAGIIDLNKKTVRALRERDPVRQEAAAVTAGGCSSSS